MAQTSQIVIDQISTEVINATNPTMQHLISSGDAVLAIFVGSNSAAPTVQVNGVNVPAAVTATATTPTASIFLMKNPPVGVVTITIVTVNPIGVMAASLLGVGKAYGLPITKTGTASAATINTVIQVAQANSMIMDIFFDPNLDTLTPTQAGQVEIVNEPVSGLLAFASSFQIVSKGLQTMGWAGGTSVTMPQAMIVLEPAHAPSMWFPNIDLRNSNDVTGPNDLDFGTEILASTQLSYGYKASTFYQNSFLHTIGRILAPTAGGIVNASVAQVAADLTFTGGTQAVAAIQLASVTQVAATLTFTGGAQAVASVQKVAITQVAATLTFTGGTQAVTSVSFATIAQSAATLTFTGGTQAVASKQIVAITQVAANLTFTGGTQAVATINDVAITQTHATLTFTGGTQVVASGGNVFITQVGASLAFTGGTQSVVAAALVNAAITQAHATLTFTGGTQSSRAFTPPDFIPLTITLQSKPLEVTLTAAVNLVLLNDDRSLAITLTAPSKSVTISGRPTQVTLQGKTTSVTLNG